jgi:hypothetical protein
MEEGRKMVISKKVERIGSAMSGTLLLVVLVPQIPKLPSPVNAQAAVYDAWWAVAMGSGIWLLLYAVGVVRRKSKAAAS